MELNWKYFLIRTKYRFIMTEGEGGECVGGVSFFLNFTRRHCPSYRLQWWSCPGATQWGRPFSKEGLSELALVGDSRNPWVRRSAAVSIDTNNKLVLLLLGVCMCECDVWVPCGLLKQKTGKTRAKISKLISVKLSFSQLFIGKTGQAASLCFSAFLNPSTLLV